MIKKITDILVETTNVDPAKVSPESKLKDDLGIDSLDSVELVLELETQFDVRIEDEELAALVTVGDIIELIQTKTN